MGVKGKEGDGSIELDQVKGRKKMMITRFEICKKKMRKS